MERMRGEERNDYRDRNEGDDHLSSESEVFVCPGGNILCQGIPVETQMDDGRNKKDESAHIVNTHQEMFKHSWLGVGSAEMQRNARQRQKKERDQHEERSESSFVERLRLDLRHDAIPFDRWFPKIEPGYLEVDTERS